MGILHQRHSLLASLVFLCLIGNQFSVRAQLLDGKFPKLFNRDRKSETGRRGGGGGDITFVRSFGIPKPRSVKIETLKGYEVTFEITADTKTPGMMVDFLVRDHPTAGKLVGILSNPKNRSSAKVIYYADPNSAATMDSFTFAARYPGGKYSGMARCDIKIEEAQPEIQVTEAADFGKVLVGESAEREIMIINKGNAPYNRTMQLFSPWKMLSPKDGRIAIGAGGRLKVKIGFKPTFGGEANYQLALSRGKSGVCKLKGEAILPFSISQEEWELKLNPETGQREAAVIALNNTEKPFEVFLRSSPRLLTRAREKTVLFPGKKNKVDVYLLPNDVNAFDGGLEMKVRSGYSAMTSVFAPTLPANLSIEVPGQLGNEVINFGKVNAGRSAERGILLTNTGGELLALAGSVPKPFRIIGDLDRQLGPLESIPLSLGFYPAKNDRGGADQFAVFRTGNQEVKIRLVGNSVRPPGAPRIPLPSPAPIDKPASSNPDRLSPSSIKASSNNLIDPIDPVGQIGNRKNTNRTPAADRTPPSRKSTSTADGLPWFANSSSDEVAATMSPLGIPTLTLVERELAPGLRSAEDFQLLSANAKMLEFGWTAPKGSEIDTFEVEMRGERINPENLNAESVWAPYPEVEFERVGRLVKAKSKKAQPDYLL